MKLKRRITILLIIMLIVAVLTISGCNKVDIESHKNELDNLTDENNQATNTIEELKQKNTDLDKAASQEQEVETSNENTLERDYGINFEYEEVGRKGNLLIVIYTETESLDELHKIIKKYKELLKNYNIYQIMFFNDLELAKGGIRQGNMSKNEVHSWFATYNFNKNTGYDKLSETYN